MDIERKEKDRWVLVDDIKKDNEKWFKLCRHLGYECEDGKTPSLEGVIGDNLIELEEENKKLKKIIMSPAEQEGGFTLIALRQECFILGEENKKLKEEIGEDKCYLSLRENVISSLNEENKELKSKLKMVVRYPVQHAIYCALECGEMDNPDEQDIKDRKILINVYKTVFRQDY
jgi:hypothetical protein